MGMSGVTRFRTVPLNSGFGDNGGGKSVMYDGGDDGGLVVSMAVQVQQRVSVIVFTRFFGL